MQTLLDLVREERAALIKPATDLIAAAETGERQLSEAEWATIRSFSPDENEAVKQLDERIATLSAQERADAAANEQLPARSVRVKSEPLTYDKSSRNSFIRDHAVAAGLINPTNSTGSRQDASDRLQRHSREVEVEMRANSTGDTAGGTFVPPLWVLSEFVGVQRPGRAAANLARQLSLPSGTDSINIPTITTGTLTAIQATENTAATSRDMVTGSTTADVTTIAGVSEFSLQLLEQSPLAGGWDQLVFGDLTNDYDRALDINVLAGTGSSNQNWGISTVAGTSVTVSTAAGTALYSGIADAINRVATTRYQIPQVIVMHPRRWFWFASRQDTTGRPLVTPDAQAGQNLLAAMGVPKHEGVVGTMLGLPVVIDANITTTGSTYFDEVYVWRASDALLMEGSPRFEVFRTTGGSTDTLTARARLYNYAAFTTRFATAVATVTGAGLTGPTF